MSKRKDATDAYRVGYTATQIAETAWELGRIAGIREAAGIIDKRHFRMDGQRDSGVLREHARKLKRRLK